MNFPIQDVFASDLMFSARYDIFNDIRHPEDGHQLEGTAHYIVAETSDGRRFSRHYKNNCWLEDTSEEGEPIVYLSESVESIQAVLDPIVDRLNASILPKLNVSQWRESEPRYGTQAWLNWHQEQVMDNEYMNQ